MRNSKRVKNFTAKPPRNAKFAKSDNKNLKITAVNVQFRHNLTTVQSDHVLFPLANLAPLGGLAVFFKKDKDE